MYVGATASKGNITGFYYLLINVCGSDLTPPPFPGPNPEYRGLFVFSFIHFCAIGIFFYQCALSLKSIKS